jgi:hypothetical protein
VLSEIYSNKYHGQTGWNMLTALFALLVEDKSINDVRKALGLPTFADAKYDQPYSGIQ